MAADDADFDFASADAGASETFPMQCSALRKNGFVMIKVSFFKGHNKVCIVFPLAVLSWWSTTDLYRMKTVMEITFNWFYYHFSCLHITTSKSNDLSMSSSIFRIVHARLWRCQPPRPASTGTPKSTWWLWISSQERNSKIFAHPPTTWRCQT